MFADPAVISINGSNKSLVKINQDGYSSEYLLRTDTEEYRLNIRNTSRTDKVRGVRIDRHNAELIHTVFPVAPSTLAIVRKAYAVVENQQGDALANPAYVAGGLLSFLTSSTNANILKMMNSES